MDLVWLWLALPLAALHVAARGSTREWTQDVDSCPNTDVEAGYVTNTAILDTLEAWPTFHANLTIYHKI